MNINRFYAYFLHEENMIVVFKIIDKTAIEASVYSISEKIGDRFHINEDDYKGTSRFDLKQGKDIVKIIEENDGDIPDDILDEFLDYIVNDGYYNIINNEFDVTRIDPKQILIIKRLIGDNKEVKE